MRTALYIAAIASLAFSAIAPRTARAQDSTPPAIVTPTPTPEPTPDPIQAARDRIAHAQAIVDAGVQAIQRAAAVPAPAATPPIYPGQRPLKGDLRVVELAKSFWRARHVAVAGSDGLTIFRAPNLVERDGDALGRGESLAGRRYVWLADWLVDALTSRQADRPLKVSACAVLTHELGHAYGLSHAASGVMTEDGAKRHAEAPFFCRQWARQASRPGPGGPRDADARRSRSCRSATPRTGASRPCSRPTPCAG